MRKWSTVVAAASLFALTAGAQMKAPQPATATTAPSVQQLQAAAPVATLESARRINRDAAMKLVKEKKAVWVDVRNKESYEAGHLPGAYFIPEAELVGRLKELPPGRMIIAYCA